MITSNNEKPIPTSLMLKIGLGVFDGGDRAWLAKTYSVSTDEIDRSWLQCRKWLSQHFAKVEGRDYELLDETALQERLVDSLRHLIAWRSRALQDEFIDKATATESPSDEADCSLRENNPTQSETS